MFSVLYGGVSAGDASMQKSAGSVTETKTNTMDSLTAGIGQSLELTSKQRCDTIIRV